MRRHVSLLALTFGLVAPSGAALALCTPAAPAPALSTFTQDPQSWIAKYGKSSDLGNVSLSVAATAVNSNDAQFGKALGAMLGAASSDQGRVIGHALSGLAASCSDPKDPADVADKKYISLNILPNLLSNLSANVAYGEGTGTETTSTGGGGGGGGGNGLTGAGLPEGGSNNGSGPNGSTSTPTSGDPVGNLSAGSVGATASEFLTSDSLLGSSVAGGTTGGTTDDEIPISTVNTPATISTTPGGTASGSVSANQ